MDPSGGLSSVHQGVPQPTYTLYAAFGASPGIALAWTGGTPADQCYNDGTLPFAAGLPVLATLTLKSGSTTLAGSSTDTFPGLMGSVHREWSLVPAGLNPTLLRRREEVRVRVGSILALCNSAVSLPPYARRDRWTSWTP